MEGLLLGIKFIYSRLQGLKSTSAAHLLYNIIEFLLSVIAELVGAKFKTLFVECKSDVACFKDQ